MTETCLQHEGISRNTALIPDMRDDLAEIKSSLLGTMEKPGWIGRIADLEKQMLIVTRVAWGILATVGLAVGGSILQQVVK